MGEPIAPSPRNGGKRGGKGPNRRKQATGAAAAGGSREQAASGEQRNSDNRFFGNRNGWLGKTAYAALDLGTNNCRLLIARAASTMASSSSR